MSNSPDAVKLAQDIMAGEPMSVPELTEHYSKEQLVMIVYRAALKERTLARAYLALRAQVTDLTEKLERTNGLLIQYETEAGPLRAQVADLREALGQVHDAFDDCGLELSAHQDRSLQRAAAALSGEGE